ncbi:MAG: VOC family protein [Marinicella sp.]
MGSVIGVGGIFFKSDNPSRLYAWYEKYLNMKKGEGPGVSLKSNSKYTVWSIFASDSDYFSPGSQAYMFNLVVDNLDETLQQVEAGGAKVIGGIDDWYNGRFGWFLDPDGNKVELWEPNGQ